MADVDPDSSEGWRRRAIERLSPDVYGCDAAWKCDRWIGGWGDWSLALTHQDEFARVTVSTQRVDRAYDLLGEGLALESYVAAKYPVHERRDYPIDIHVERWDVDVWVDGVATTFVFIGDEVVWSARATMGDRAVTVDGLGLAADALVLAKVDLTDYRVLG